MARCYLRLSDEEFYRLTPRQFSWLMKRQKEVIEHRELLFGIVASTIANYSLGAPKKPLQPKDFMPTQHVKQALQKPKRRNRKKEAEQIRQFFLAQRNTVVIDPHGKHT